MPIEDFVPTEILALKTEANLDIVNSWFDKSLAVSGDVAEFGCFRGTMSIKYAFWIKALGQSGKHVFAFDTFRGFEMDDPSGGPIKKGDYSDNASAYDNLRKWERFLPLSPVWGDARETHACLTYPLSFVWLDLDMEALLRPVVAGIWPLLTEQTIIGLDDYGRPECPSVKPWADEIEDAGLWKKLAGYRDAFIVFYERTR